MEQEKELRTELEKKQKEVSELAIVDQPTYLLAGNEVKELTELKKKVSSYWEEPKSSAYKTWKNLCKKEKDMLEPIENSLSLVKENIGAYQLKIENELEETAQKAKEEYGVEIVARTDLPKLQGISSSTTWEIESIDLNLLPKFIDGTALVKADESKIKKLIKNSKGTIEIPGVKYTKKKIVKTTGRG